MLLKSEVLLVGRQGLWLGETEEGSQARWKGGRDLQSPNDRTTVFPSRPHPIHPLLSF